VKKYSKLLHLIYILINILNLRLIKLLSRTHQIIRQKYVSPNCAKLVWQPITRKKHDEQRVRTKPDSHLQLLQVCHIFTNNDGRIIKTYVGLVKIWSKILNSDLTRSFKYSSNGCTCKMYQKPNYCMWTHKCY